MHYGNHYGAVRNDFKTRQPGLCRTCKYCRRGADIIHSYRRGNGGLCRDRRVNAKVFGGRCIINYSFQNCGYKLSDGLLSRNYRGIGQQAFGGKGGFGRKNNNFGGVASDLQNAYGADFKPVAIKIALILLLIICILMFFPMVSYASDDNEQNSVGELLNKLDTSQMDEFLSELTDEQKSIFDSISVGERIKRIVSGEIALDAKTFFGYFSSLIGISTKKMLPFLCSILAICVACAFINSVKGKLASESVHDIVNLCFSAIIITLLAVQLSSLIGQAKNMIESIKTQTEIFMPVILTLMVAGGSTTTAGVYQPMIAIFSAGITQLMSVIILPLLIAALVFGFISGLSSSIKLKKLSDFFLSTVKWLMSVSFFIFLAYMGVQGITASVYDNVTVRATKFALGNYVPVIGGYLSDGLGVIISGSVLIKNAVGMCAIILLMITVVPIILQIVVFGIGINFLSAVAEPIGCEQISVLLGQISKCIKLLSACLFGVAFLFFIFIILMVLTGNLMI